MTPVSQADARFMRRALDLARRARPSPNPRVGAVIVRDGEIVGEGYHERPGLPHAEIVALRQAGDLARGADIYITLEPCPHMGRTGPCTEALHAAGVRDVVVGMTDPDERVLGRGVERLTVLGHEVRVGVLEDECRRMLEGYAMQRIEGRPLVRLKAAISLDGAISDAAGKSQWITGPEARARAHALRADSDAVIVGVSTVLADDPLLTVRDAAGPSPLRVVLDSALRTPLESRIADSASPSLPVVLAHTEEGNARADSFAGRPGLETLLCRADERGRVDAVDLLRLLAARDAMSILVEGGAQVLSSFAGRGLADRFSVFIAPKLIGSARSWIAFPQAVGIDSAIPVRIDDAMRLGDDFLLEGAFAARAAAIS